MSFAFLVSSIFKGPIGATITVLFALFVSPAVDGIIVSQMVVPWFTPFSSVNSAFVALLSSPEQYENQTFLPFGLHENAPLGISVALIAAYTIGSAIISITLFKKRDM
jgi:ABC-type transport system involved in multi-copper enzyme maturation permease subunit